MSFDTLLVNGIIRSGGELEVSVASGGGGAHAARSTVIRHAATVQYDLDANGGILALSVTGRAGAGAGVYDSVFQWLASISSTSMPNLWYDVTYLGLPLHLYRKKFSELYGGSSPPVRPSPDRRRRVAKVSSTLIPLMPDPLAPMLAGRSGSQSPASIFITEEPLRLRTPRFVGDEDDEDDDDDVISSQKNASAGRRTLAAPFFSPGLRRRKPIDLHIPRSRTALSPLEAPQSGSRMHMNSIGRSLSPLSPLRGRDAPEEVHVDAADTVARLHPGGLSAFAAYRMEEATRLTRVLVEDLVDDRKLLQDAIESYRLSVQTQAVRRSSPTGKTSKRMRERTKLFAADNALRKPESDFEYVEEKLRMSLGLLSLLDDSSSNNNNNNSSSSNTNVTGGGAGANGAGNAGSTASPGGGFNRPSSPGSAEGRVPGLQKSKRSVEAKIADALLNEVNRENLDARADEIRAYRRQRKVYGKDFIEDHVRKFSHITPMEMEMERRRKVETAYMRQQRFLLNYRAIVEEWRRKCERVRMKHNDEMYYVAFQKEADRRASDRRAVLSHAQTVIWSVLISHILRVHSLHRILVFDRIGRKFAASTYKAVCKLQGWWRGIMSARRAILKAQAIARLRLFVRPHVRGWQNVLRSRAVTMISKLLRELKKSRGMFMTMKRFRWKAITIQRWWRKQQEKEAIRLAILRLQWDLCEVKKLKAMERRQAAGKKAILYMDLIKKHPGQQPFSELSALARNQGAGDLLRPQMSRVQSSVPSMFTAATSSADDAAGESPAQTPAAARGHKSVTFTGIPDYDPVEIAKVVPIVRDSILLGHLREKISGYRRLMLVVYKGERLVMEARRSKDFLEEARRMMMVVSSGSSAKTAPRMRLAMESTKGMNFEGRRRQYEKVLPGILKNLMPSIQMAYEKVRALFSAEPRIDIYSVYPDEFEDERYLFPRPFFKLLPTDEEMTVMVEIGQIQMRREQLIENYRKYAAPYKA